MSIQFSTDDTVRKVKERINTLINDAEDMYNIITNNYIDYIEYDAINDEYEEIHSSLFVKMIRGTSPFSTSLEELIDFTNRITEGLEEVNDLINKQLEMEERQKQKLKSLQQRVVRKVEKLEDVVNDISVSVNMMKNSPTYEANFEFCHNMNKLTDLVNPSLNDSVVDILRDYIDTLDMMYNSDFNFFNV